MKKANFSSWIFTCLLCRKVTFSGKYFFFGEENSKVLQNLQKFASICNICKKKIYYEKNKRSS